MKMRTWMLALSLFAVSQLANASIVTQLFTLQVKAETPGMITDPSCTGGVLFHCGQSYIGNVYAGSFNVDSSIYETDGWKSGVTIYNWLLPLGELTDPFDLVSAPPLGSIPGMSVVNLGKGPSGGGAPYILIENHKVAGFWGELRGAGDTIGLDFLNPAGNEFSARDNNVCRIGGCVYSAIGALSFAPPLPEPGSLALSILALGSLGLSLRAAGRNRASLGA